MQRRLQHLRQMGLLDPQQQQDPAEETDFPERLGDYRLIERIGGGGMGVVYLAEQESLGRKVALKLVRPDQSYFTSARARFRREVDLIARLQHPGIVQIYSVGDEAGIPYFAMERVQGASLDALLEELQGRVPLSLRGNDLIDTLLALPAARGWAALPRPASDRPADWPSACIELVDQVARALDHAHQNGVIHRDLKPSNVMLSHDGRAMLVDFGLSSSRQAGQLTRTGAMLGSLPYMSPEQIRGKMDDVNERSDIYSLGVTLYELLTLRLPFPAQDSEEARQQILRGEPVPIRTLNPQVSWDAETVCMTAMEPAAERRYASAAELADDLRRVLEHRPIRARRPGRWLRGKRWMQRHPALTVGLVAAALVIVGVVFFALQQRASNRALIAASRETSAALAREQESRSLAETRYNDLVRLADLRNLQELQGAQEKLWPVHPDQVAPLRQWIQEAEELVARQALHEAALTELRRQGTRRSEPDGPGEEHHEFEDRQLQWWHDNLALLVRGLREFAAVDAPLGGLQSVRERLARSETIVARSIEAFELEWEDVAAYLEFDERYAGLELEPQVGLVPLGPDPDSGLLEFWVVESGTRPPRDEETEQLLIEPDAGLVLVLLPGGSSWMGAQSRSASEPNYDPHAEITEQPVVDTRLPAFFLSKYEVTQAQWQHVMGSNPSFFQQTTEIVSHLLGDTRRNPVEQVTWDECRSFLLRLGLAFPTEAHWEYACRAGTGTPWSTGDRPESLQGYLNLADEASVRAGNSTMAFEPGFDDGFLQSSPVGTYRANAFGLHDMHGNVGEFCRNVGPYAPLRADSEYPLGLEDRPSSTRVVRGGSLDALAIEARSANKSLYSPIARNATKGLRPARAISRSP